MAGDQADRSRGLRIREGPQEGAHLSDAFVDTSVIIRLVTGDDPQKQDASAGLFKRVEAGEVRLAAPSSVVSEAVFVLTSPRLYACPRSVVRNALVPLLALPGFDIESKEEVVAALDLFATLPYLDFGDAMIIAAMRATDATALYSYDEDFDRVAGVTRLPP